MVCTRGQLQRAAVEQPTRPDPSPTAEDQSDRLKQAPTPVLAERSLNTLPMSGPQKAAGEALPGRSPTPVAPPKKLTGDDRPLKRLPDTVQATDKLPDGPEPVAVEVEYPSREELTRVVGSPEQALSTLLSTTLASADWVEVCHALGTLRQLTVHEPAALLEPHLSQLVPLVLKSVRSLRSSVTKTAILAVGDLFLSLGDALLALADVGGAAGPTTSLLGSLLLKAASSEKQFVVTEAQRTLELAADSVDPAALSALLLPYTEHKSPKVRGRTAIVLSLAQARVQDNTLRGIPVPSLLAASGRLLTDNTPEAREAAKKLLAHVRAAFEQTEAAGVAVPKAAEEGAPAPTPWEAYCRAQLPGSTALAVLRAQQ
uniref:TOG domain-containing protein n=1 Tax=Auxenochlorella protothecoides TaxID=3075 RepID=A0A1D2AET2_AUXPR